MMRAGKDYGTRIVRTIASSSTIVGDGDIHIDERGNAYRQISALEAQYFADSGSTCPTVIRKIHNGRIY